MTNVVARAAGWFMDLRRGEYGQSLASFSMILLFAVVAAGLAIVLMSSGVLEIGGGSGTPGVEAPNFEPPNPFD